MSAIWIFAPLVALFLRRESRPGRAALAALVTGAALLVTALTLRAPLPWPGEAVWRDSYDISINKAHFALLGVLFAALALPLWAIQAGLSSTAVPLRLFLVFHTAVILTILPSRAMISVAMSERSDGFSETFLWFNLAATLGAMLAALSLTVIILLGLAAAWRLLRSRGQS